MTNKHTAIVSYVLSNTMATGSDAWGISHSGSDRDFFSMPEVYDEMMQMLMDADIELFEGSSVFGGIKFRIYGKEYNVWPVQDEAVFKAWSTCTGIMKDACRYLRFQEQMKNKHKRVEFFEYLRRLTGADASSPNHNDKYTEYITRATRDFDLDEDIFK